MANWTRFWTVQTVLAPISSMHDSPDMVGTGAMMAGLCILAFVPSMKREIAMRAPVFPEEMMP